MTALHAPQQLKRGIPLALRGIGKSFGEREVLKGIDLLIPAGQFVAVVGRCGCGKSTLLRLLAGLDKPSRGELLAGTAALEDAREETRLMFQDSRLLPPLPPGDSTCRCAGGVPERPPAAGPRLPALPAARHPVAAPSNG